ncbi:hypothetical protein [Bacillus sp. FJAT-50079]|uniref:hypothetical protein n=1 Tax=Bacillus sp. FJAT-50079 TaxID=2833577 RepID=UPI001BC9D8DB|nr:hypothetical protein [Bacillus sp. FJAT-50079]
MSNRKGVGFRDWGTASGILKYLFMGVFLLFFAMDAISKKTYRIHFYTSLTVAILFLMLEKNWSPVLKIGTIALVVLLTIKTIVDERKRWANKEV